MGFVSVLGFARQLISQRVQSGETVIDGTVGNGVDTVYLAKLVGSRGSVYGFDIQPQALEQAKQRLAQELGDTAPSVHLLLQSHEFAAEAVPAGLHGHIGAAMFNLGYLPGADHSTITKAKSTIPALEACLRLLRKGGIVTVVLYSGHQGGQAEADSVEAWVSMLPQSDFQSLRYQFTNQRNHPPYLIAIEKR